MRLSGGVDAAVAGWRKRRDSRSHAASDAAQSASTATRRRSRQRKDIQRPAFLGVLRQVFHRVDEAAGATGVARIEVVRDDRTGPAADAREHRDVLFAV